MMEPYYNMTIIRQRSVNQGLGFLPMKFKKNRLPRKQKKEVVKKHGSKFVKLFASTKIYFYDSVGRPSNEFNSVYVGGIDPYNETK